MSDGERARIRNVMELFAKASTKVAEGSPQHLVYTSVCLALDWAAETTVVRGKLFEGLIDQVKGFGITYDPNTN